MEILRSKDHDYYRPADYLRVPGHENAYFTSLDGVYYFEKKPFADDRGFFVERLVLPEMADIYGDPSIVTAQENLSFSKEGVLRGIHSESMYKFISVISGDVLAVIVDTRPYSATFRQTLYLKLGKGPDALRGRLCLPPSVGNSFQAVRAAVVDGEVYPGVLYHYLVTKTYQELTPQDKLAINPFDTELGISWSTHTPPVISDRDLANSVSFQAFINLVYHDGARRSLSQFETMLTAFRQNNQSSL